MEPRRAQVLWWSVFHPFSVCFAGRRRRIDANFLHKCCWSAMEPRRARVLWWSVFHLFGVCFADRRRRIDADFLNKFILSFQFGKVGKVCSFVTCNLFLSYK
jgi:hypothetical protein